MDDLPNFSAWDRADLENWAVGSFRYANDLHAQVALLRQHLRESRKQHAEVLVQLQRNQDDWK